MHLPHFHLDKKHVRVERRIQGDYFSRNVSTTTAVNWTFWANMLESKRQEMTITCLKLRPTTNTTTTITYSHPTWTGTWSSGNLRRSRMPSKRCKNLELPTKRIGNVATTRGNSLWKWHGSCTDCFSFKNTWNAPSMKLSSIPTLSFLTTHRHPPFILREWLRLREQNYRELNTHNRK